jgi:L-threonylcarbamoyladenylate synthase
VDASGVRIAAGDNEAMKTLLLRVDPERMHEPEAQAALDRAAEILRGGGTVALPTETVYGLGANALDAGAVEKIFVAKERPHWDPLIVHVCDAAMLAMVTDGLPERARILMERFWPGPLTLLLPRSKAIPDAVTAGRPLVAVRMPAHAVMREVIRRAGMPIAAPSANRFGHTSPTTAEHVLEDLDGRIDAVVDSGAAEFGVESTVLDPCASPMVIYRPGAIALEEIRKAAGAVEVFRETKALDESPRDAMPSPGVGLRHYAPRARLILVEASKLAAETRSHSGERVGVMLPEALAGAAEFESGVQVFAWGKWGDAEELAHNLFAGLRELDAAGCAVILCPVPEGEGIALAIRDRLRKAAEPAQ